MTAGAPQALHRVLVILALIIAGESIFLLPFVVQRVFKPTLLDVFEITNFELGVAFSVYGFVAMAAYFAGGPLADRFSARRLMAAALVTTALGGGLYASIPSLNVLVVLYGCWGLTTILLFWAALIRATREWGGVRHQGLAYGLLDGGRGLLAAVLGSIAVLVFAALLPDDVASASLAQRATALNRVIWLFTGCVIAVAGFVWMVVPDERLQDLDTDRPAIAGLFAVTRKPVIWANAAIVLCAYFAYKSTDNFSLYARDAFGYNDVDAAVFGTLSLWMRPVAAIGVGLIADRCGASRMLLAGFAIILLGSLALALGLMQPGLPWLLVATVASTCVGIYAVRALYFALFEEARVPLHVTGSAIGLVSFIGFTPEIFWGPLTGYLIDRAPGAAGHQHVFAVLALFAAAGLAATLVFRRLARPVDR